MAKDLDRLTEVIKGALQEGGPVAGAKPGPGAAFSGGDKEVNRDSATTVQLNRDQDLKSDKWQDSNQKDTDRMKLKGEGFFS